MAGNVIFFNNRDSPKYTMALSGLTRVVTLLGFKRVGEKLHSNSIVRIYCVALFVLLGMQFVHAQILPAPDSKLNYTQIMFQHEPIPGAEQYVIEVTGDIAGATFNHPIIQKTDSAPATIIGGFMFGNKYTWRYSGIKNGKKMKWAGPYHFEILDLPHDTTAAIDAGYYRAHICTNDTTKNNGGYIVNDLTHTVINRQGQPVWFLPNPEKWLGQKGYLSDLRITPYGTVTFLNDSNGFECDLNGNIAWQAPNDSQVSGDTREYYNHLIQRLPGGHYMVLSKKMVWMEIPNGGGAGKQYMFETKKINSKPFAKVEFGTLIEYDKQGHVTWSWNSEKYFTPADVFYPETSVFDQGNDRGGHMNAFVVDKNNEYIYCGFRNYSRVIKIRRATGEVVYSWGRQMPSGEARAGHNYFLNQHDCQVLRDGNIAVFNNGDYRQLDVPSSVVIFSQPTADSASRIVWQFDCNFSSLPVNKSKRRGNVDELANGNLLVCMGQVPRIFELTRSKQVVWEAVFELAETDKVLWLSSHLCRAHYTSSLYPCYFAAQLNGQTAAQKTTELTLRIFNVGSEEDSYTVTISSPAGSILKQFSTALIPAGRSGSYDISSGVALLGDGGRGVVVRSNTNTDFEQVVFGGK